MIRVIRQLCFFAIAAALSWWFMLAGDPVTLTSPPEPPSVPGQLALMPVTHAVAEEVAPISEPTQPELREVSESMPEAISEATAEEREESSASAAATPPEPIEEVVEESTSEALSELGDPEAEGEVAAVAESAPDAPESLMSDSALVDAARRELSGEVQRGFATDLLSDPTEQLEIARAFGEELVLVPRSSLETSVDQQVYFRLTDGGEVQRVVGLTHVDAGRYRDFFQFEYAKLPEPIRRLRKSVLNRGEVYLFAALIPVQEWALVVGRRERALQASGRELDAVRRFTLDYERIGEGRYDIVVDEILFTDGTRYRPANETP